MIGYPGFHIHPGSIPGRASRYTRCVAAVGIVVWWDDIIGLTNYIKRKRRRRVRRLFFCAGLLQLPRDGRALVDNATLT